MNASLALATPDTLSGWMRERRSVRRYSAQPLSPGVVDDLIEASRWAPSAHNRQPWRFVVLMDDADKARLAEAMGQRLRVDRLADGDDPKMIEQGVARSHARISTAPVVIAACFTMTDMDTYPDPRRAEAERTMAVQSTAMAVQNLLLLAHAEGLCACWMCAPLFCPDTVKAALALPTDWEPQALITLGYPAAPGRKRERRGIAEIVRQ
jgi:F420 biosynthesis protein FbiB-like protein